jgi:hypothetical protein
MQADWEFEVGGDAPVIDAVWSGLVDLRLHPEAVADLPEVQHFSGFASALRMLNAASSPVWTSKCDFWPALDPDEFSADELDAPPEMATHAAGCYIDILPVSDEISSNASLLERVCKRTCLALAAVVLQGCRVDLIVRRALIREGSLHLGITAYVTACASAEDGARELLGKALGALTSTFRDNSTLQ